MTLSSIQPRWPKSTTNSVTGPTVDGSGERAGENRLARIERDTDSLQPVRQPHDAHDRVVQDAGTQTGLLDNAVARTDGSGPPQFATARLVGRHPLGTHDDSGVRSIVGDRVAHGAGPTVVGMHPIRASVDQFECGHDVVGRGVHVVGGEFTIEAVRHESVLEDERELDLDLRIEVVLSGDRITGRR